MNRIDQTRTRLAQLVVVLALCSGVRICAAQELVDNGDFSNGLVGWSNISIYFNGNPYPGGVSITDDAPHVQSLKLSGFLSSNYSLWMEKDILVTDPSGPLQVSFDWKVPVKEPSLGINFVMFMFHDADDACIGKIVHFDTSRPAYHTLEHLRLWGSTAPADAYYAVRKLSAVFDWEHISVSSEALPGMNPANVRRIEIWLFVQNDSGMGGEMLVDNLSVYDTSFVDCNENGVSDAIDIAQGTSLDCLGNGTPDECELVSEACPFLRGDVNNDGSINGTDVLQFTAVLLGLTECGCSVDTADMNADGVVNLRDIRPFKAVVACHLGLPAGPQTGELAGAAALVDLARMAEVELDLGALLIATEQQGQPSQQVQQEPQRATPSRK